jgi:hypothetical protein
MGSDSGKITATPFWQEMELMLQTAMVSQVSEAVLGK